MTLPEEELARVIAREIVERIRAAGGRSPLTGEPLLRSPAAPHRWPQPLERAVLSGGQRRLPVAVSARHVHLSPEDVRALFGPGHELKVQKWLSQPNQFAAAETVSLIGPRGAIAKVRVLGPARGATQVEVSATDARVLGFTVPVRLSGDHTGTPGITLEGPRGRVTIPRGVIIAARHIHMHPDEAAAFGVQDKQLVRVRCPGPRQLIFDQVVVRVSPGFLLEMHIDTDEGNAAGLRDGDLVDLID